VVGVLREVGICASDELVGGPGSHHPLPRRVVGQDVESALAGCEWDVEDLLAEHAWRAERDAVNMLDRCVVHATGEAEDEQRDARRHNWTVGMHGQLEEHAAAPMASARHAGRKHGLLRRNSRRMPEGRTALGLSS
jgi:hypothetical protein